MTRNLFTRGKAAVFTIVTILLLAATLPQAATAHEGHVHGEAAEQAAEPSNAQAGAEMEVASELAQSAQILPHEASAESAAEGASGGFFTLLTNLHPASVHFPIALLLVGAFAQFFADWRGSDKLGDAAAFMTIVGGATAFVAAVFGWIHTGLWFGGDNTMQWHRWVGSGLGILGPVVAWLAMKRGDFPAAYRGLLYMLAAALLFQGYWGAEISFGAGHLWK